MRDDAEFEIIEVLGHDQEIGQFTAVDNCEFLM